MKTRRLKLIACLALEYKKLGKSMGSGKNHRSEAVRRKLFNKYA